MGTVAVVIVIVVVLLAIAGVAALVLARRRRQQQLQQEFGPEYERRVSETGDRKEAERELRQRKERHDQHQLRPLQGDERQRFHADWQQVQRGFVDDPGGAVEHADALLVTIMRARGYPVEGGERRTDDLSVAQPHLVEDYREAQRVVTAHRQGSATTEDLRAAFTSFRTLVEAMLDDGAGQGGYDGAPGGPGGRSGGQPAGPGQHGGQPGGPGQYGGQPGGPGGQYGGPDDQRGPAGGTERVPGAPGGGPGQYSGPPAGATERIEPSRGGAPGQGAPPAAPAGPGRPPSAPPATGGPDGHQERRR